MATPLICLKISPENVKQLSVKTSSAKRSSVSVEGSLTVRWSKKYLSAESLNQNLIRLLGLLLRSLRIPNGNLYMNIDTFLSPKVGQQNP